MLSEADIERLARASIAANKGVPGNYINRKELVCRMTGIRAEDAFADKYGFVYDQRRVVKGGSDGGYDFEAKFLHGVTLTFDIKCRDSDKWEDLLVQPDKYEHGRIADYFVVARCFNREIHWIGWEDPKIVRCMPIDQTLPHPAHVRWSEELRPMDALNQLMLLRVKSARPA